MNIFYLDPNAVKCAKMHCDKHVVKMIVEYSQLLSTAHRVLDGDVIEGRSPSGRRQKQYVLPKTHIHADLLYKATHVNHPSAVWVRESYANYRWVYSLFAQLCIEYKHRYGKTHACWTKLAGPLEWPPHNIAWLNNSHTPLKLAMPDEYKDPCPVKSYRTFYKTKAQNFTMSWTNRQEPKWWTASY